VARDALVFCLATALAALAWKGVAAAASVLGGGLLIGVSFHALGSGVASIAGAASGGATARTILVRALVKLVFRYALLGFLAYVMIARLRLHPIGLLVGASSVTAAACFEAARSLAKKAS
jgi:hypothetical protein